MEEKEIQTCVDGAIKTYFDKFAERVTQESENYLKKLPDVAFVIQNL